MLDLIYQPRPLVNQSPNLGVPNIDVSRLEPECTVNVDPGRIAQIPNLRRGFVELAYRRLTARSQFSAARPLAPESFPWSLVGHVDHLKSIADAWAENRHDLGLILTRIERSMDYARRNKGRVAGAKDSLLLVYPLLDSTIDHKHHLFLAGMLVKVVTLSRDQAAFNNGQLRRASMGRTAKPTELPPIKRLPLGLVF
jgi:hypothetical protein